MSMNIFVLDVDPEQAAIWHCDAHVVKMALEATQIVSTVYHTLGQVKPWIYRKTHANHPCVLWSGRTPDNFSWLVQYGLELCKEYSYRYNKTHACQRILEHSLADLPEFPSDCHRGLQPWALAMPDDIRDHHSADSEGVSAYREYYRLKRVTMNKFHYTKRLLPFWL